MNRISLLFDRVRWRPSFFVCTTTNIERPDWRRDIVRTVELGIPTFIWDRLLDNVSPCDNLVPIHCTHGSEVTHLASDEWWSYDVAERVCKFGTSMLPALQIAVYMGFNPIYLVGCDLGFRQRPRGFWGTILGRAVRRILWPSKQLSDPNHFDGSYGTPGLSADRLNINMRAAHDLVLRSTRRIGVEVANATLGGELDIYPRASLSEVLGLPAK